MFFTSYLTFYNIFSLYIYVLKVQIGWWWAVVMKTGPNDARCVVWALDNLFFCIIFCIIKYIYIYLCIPAYPRLGYRFRWGYKSPTRTPTPNKPVNLPAGLPYPWQSLPVPGPWGTGLAGTGHGFFSMCHISDTVWHVPLPWLALTLMPPPQVFFFYISFAFFYILTNVLYNYSCNLLVIRQGKKRWREQAQTMRLASFGP